MEYQPSFWMGLLCFLLFLGSIAARLARQWRSPGSRFPIGGKWTLLDALGPIGFVLMSIWLYQNGEDSGWYTILLVPAVYSYWELVRQRKRHASVISSKV